MKIPESDRRLLSEINVTPFVDVMLVLLIIFMVTAPMMMQGIDVNLPEVEAPAIPSEQERLVVTIDAQRKVYINEYPVELDVLGPKLAAIYRNTGGTQGVFLRSDESIPYGYVMHVMSIIRQSGIDQIGLVTEPVGASTESRGG
ncbi:Cell division and transport-associated protein TolR [Desulfacinum infernum DSM 9756]|uniref:Cell division and transport-associated protein TolR n=1 Tax=Desulfacinum infernum DSM 9756 TaxID=1121391 RepID=A0A1M4SD84_9BACT|nr:biopolymer transporter ExbD [Desulfacinum infernum]SHE30170.1 Cell division and transport-associated protein TolR [Desulfacinum infernum DSM 9756]